MDSFRPASFTFIKILTLVDIHNILCQAERSHQSIKQHILMTPSDCSHVLQGMLRQEAQHFFTGRGFECG